MILTSNSRGLDLKTKIEVEIIVGKTQTMDPQIWDIISSSSNLNLVSTTISTKWEVECSSTKESISNK